MKNIVTIGTIYVDIKGYPTGNFIPAGRNVGNIKYFHGGVARNIAEDVTMLGENSVLVGLTDNSSAGTAVLKHLQEINVNVDYVKATENGMGSWMAIFDNDGDVCANISKRPELLPICDILDTHGDKIFQNADGVLLEIDIDEEIVDRTIKLSKKYNLPVYAVISNMTIAKERLKYIQKTACFICNKLEAEIFFDKQTSALTPNRMLDLLKQELTRLHLHSMVITMGSDGAVYANTRGESGICPALSVRVTDTTGAGDSFFAGTTVGLIRGLSLAEACELGAKAAASVITTEENVLTKSLGA